MKSELIVAYDNILSGLISDESNIARTALRLRANMNFFASIRVAGIPAEKQYLSALTLFKESKIHKLIAEIACDCYAKAEVFLDLNILRDILNTRPLKDEIKRNALGLFDRLANIDIEDNKFRYWVTALADRERLVPMQAILSRAMQAASGQYTDPKTKIQYQGSEGVLALVSQMATIPGIIDSDSLTTPSGNIRKEEEAIREELEMASTGKMLPGTVFSGFRFIDKATNGCVPGDVVLVGAHTGEGKCVVKGSLVFDPARARPGRIGVDSISQIAGLRGNKIEPGGFGEVVDRGYLEAVEIKTAAGDIIKVGVSHLLLTDSGFKRAGSVKVGNFLASVGKFPCIPQEKDFSRLDVIILALFLAKGPDVYRLTDFPVNFENIGIVDGLKAFFLEYCNIPYEEICEKTTGTKKENIPLISVYNGRLVKIKVPKWVFLFRNALSRCEADDIDKKKGGDLEIPNSVWSFSHSLLKLFLGTMCFYSGFFVRLPADYVPEKYLVGLTVYSWEMAYAIKFLFLKLGIKTKIVQLKSKKVWEYRIQALRIADVVKICSLPALGRNWEQQKILDDIQINYDISLYDNQDLALYDDYDMSKFSSSDEREFFYDRIVEITRLGRKHCFDVLNSEVNNTYVVGTIIGHNSQFAHNWAWHASIEQCRNSLIITLETSRSQYRRRLLCRHTNKLDVGCPNGIPYSSIKQGRFRNQEEKNIFDRVLADFVNNEKYGVIDVTQASEGITMAEVGDRARMFEDIHGVPLHFVVVDYLGLMGGSQRRTSRQEELNDILRQAKAFATTFDNGRGVVFLTPHQTKQLRREAVKPESGKFYTSRDFSDTSEAAKVADVAIMILRTPELEESRELAAALVKCRDAETPLKVARLFERYSTSFISDIEN